MTTFSSERGLGCPMHELQEACYPAILTESGLERAIAEITKFLPKHDDPYDGDFHSGRYILDRGGARETLREIVSAGKGEQNAYPHCHKHTNADMVMWCRSTQPEECSVDVSVYYCKKIFAFFVQTHEIKQKRDTRETRVRERTAYFKNKDAAKKAKKAKKAMATIQDK